MLLAWLLTVARAGPDVAERQVISAVRAIAYDQRLANRSGEVIDLAVLGDATRTEATTRQIEQALGALGTFTIQDRVVRVERREVADFLAEPRTSDVVLIVPSHPRAAEIATVSASNGILAVGFTEEDLQAGLVLVVVQQGPRFRIVVDLPTSQAVGVRFGSQLLQLAEVRR